MDRLSNLTPYSDTRSGSFRGDGDNDAANAYTTVGLKPFTYDAAGNLFEDEHDDRYKYAFENRLVEISAFDAGGGGGGIGLSAGAAVPGARVVIAEYTYDALGRRIQAVTSDAGHRPPARYATNLGVAQETGLRLLFCGHAAQIGIDLTLMKMLSGSPFR